MASCSWHLMRQRMCVVHLSRWMGVGAGGGRGNCNLQRRAEGLMSPSTVEI